MTETTRYEIIRSWAESCETELQINNLEDMLNKRFTIEEKTKYDLLSHIKDLRKRRAWIRKEVIRRDYVPAPMKAISDIEFMCDEQPTDICNH